MLLIFDVNPTQRSTCSNSLSSSNRAYISAHSHCSWYPSQQPH